jgi:hypothetical protein
MSDTAVAESGTRLQNFLDRAGLRGFPWKTASILYTISWGWLFIVRDSYWADDWNSFLHPEITPFDYESLGLAPWTELNQVFFDLFGPGVFRLVTFCFYFGSGVVVFGITKSIEFLNLVHRKQVVLLFLLLPFGSARVTLMVFHYSTAYFAFFLAWFLFTNFSTKFCKCLYLLLFFFSFQMHSLIIFILLPILLAAIKVKVNNSLRLLMFLKDNLILIGLPFLYVGLRKLFWNEQFAYHAISMVGFIQFLKLFLVCILVLIVILFVSKFRLFSKEILIVGIATSFLALTPYVLGGFYVSSKLFVVTFFEWMLGRSDWYARHQTLQPLGAAFLIVGVLYATPINRKLKKFVFSLVLTLSVLFNFSFGFEYVVDYQKQRAISDAIAVSDNSRFINEMQIIDNTAYLNARGRAYRQRDWLGIVSLAIGVEKAVEIENIGGPCRTEDGARFLFVQGPETHWEALKNWVSDGDMGFEVTVDDTPGACKPEMVASERVSGAIPILFYFTGARG